MSTNARRQRFAAFLQLGKEGKEEGYTSILTNPSDEYTGDTKLNNSYSPKQETVYKYTGGIKQNLRQKIATEPVLRKPLDWGLSVGLLKWYCENFIGGVAFVKEMILRVDRYHDSYFIKPEPVPVQRLKLLRHIISKDGVRVSV